jgi:predicted ATPase
MTPLIDRQGEMSLLHQRWEQARDGSGQAVLLVGEPGIGKSRVIEAVRERVRDEPHRVLRYQGSPYHRQSALYPIVKQIEFAGRLSSGDTNAQKLDKLRTLLAPATDRVEQVLPLFATLLGVGVEGRDEIQTSPKRQRDQTVDALLEQLASLARLGPVLLVFEDAQWADPTTLDLLDLVVDRIRGLRVLALITARPDFISPWGGRATTVNLDRLTRIDSTAFLTSLMGGAQLPGPIFDQLLTKSDGVPLFMEELTKTVVESGILERPGPEYRLAGPLPPLAVPSTLQDSLSARLDRLGGPRELAQLAAVLGREFTYEMLRAVSSRNEASLRRDVGELVKAEILYQRGVPPEAEYVFKHALIQDAAYTTLLRSTRQQFHARIAQALEAQFPAICASEPEIVAHHYTQAGLVEPAVEYWHRAGRRAMQRSANREAVSHLRKGLEMLEALPPTPARVQRELQLHVDLGGPLSLLQGFASPDVE